MKQKQCLKSVLALVTLLVLGLFLVGCAATQTGGSTTAPSTSLVEGNFTVRFVGFDGRVIGTQKVEAGSSAIAPTPPEVEGSNFVGWDTAFDYITENIPVENQI